MNKILERVIGTIKSIAEEANDGDIIVREIRAQELKAVWTNTRTKKEYTIRSRQTTRLIRVENDPRLIPVLRFIANQITAAEAKKDIERLENLKAFW